MKPSDKRRIWFAAPALLCGLSLAAACCPCAISMAEEPTYTIQLFHPRQLDDLQRVHVVVNQTLEDIVKKGEHEQSHKTQKRRIEFTASYDVLEIDKAGLPTRLNCTVEKATAKVDPGALLELVKPNSILDVEIKDGKPIIQPASDLVKLAPEAQPLLGMLIMLSTAANESRLESMVGTSQPQKLKGTWPIKTAAVAKELADFDPQLKEKAVTGTGELTAVTKSSGKDVLEVSYTFRARSAMAVGGAPGGDMTPMGATLETTGKIEVPPDHSTGPISQKVKVVTERKYLKKPGERDRDKTPQDEIMRATDAADIHVDYLQRGIPIKK